jgi:AraC-like DNA-binding protein
MLTRFYPPHPLLQPIVSSLMIYRHQFDRGGALPVNLFPPIPEHSLYFYPRDPLVVHPLNGQGPFTCRPSIIVGPQVERVNLSLGHDHVVIRVGFRAGGLHRLLHQPLHQLIDTPLSTEEFFNAAIREVNERLAETDDFDGMKTLVEGFLLRCLAKTKPLERIDRALAVLMQSGGNLTVEYLAQESCLSLRQFERKCKERVGLSPKLFARIVRFSRAYRMREANPSLNWTTIAHQAGYFDQMHFIRDFKTFAGFTPTTIDRELSQTPGRLQAELIL